MVHLSEFQADRYREIPEIAVPHLTEANLAKRAHTASERLLCPKQFG